MIAATFLGGIVGEKAAKLIAPAIPYIIGAALIALAFTLGRCDGVSDERALNKLALERANNAALRIKAAANTIVAAQRLKDAQRLSQASQERTDAIDKAPDSKTGAATQSLGCARWVQQNPGRTDRPPACR